jgi:hypothetical protein
VAANSASFTWPDGSASSILPLGASEREHETDPSCQILDAEPIRPGEPRLDPLREAGLLRAPAEDPEHLALDVHRHHVAFRPHQPAGGW